MAFAHSYLMLTHSNGTSDLNKDFPSTGHIHLINHNLSHLDELLYNLNKFNLSGVHMSVPVQKTDDVR